MSTESLDYTAILADLEAKKAALEQTIASFRQAMAAGALGQMSSDGTVIPSLNGPSFTGGEVPAGAFLGKSITESTRLYLEIVKKKQTTREIADALRKGGMESTSNDFVGIVNAGLNRAHKSPNSGIVKVGTQWGLAGWYPKGITSGAGQSSKKSKNRKPQKAATSQAKAKEQAAVAAKESKPMPKIVTSPNVNSAQRVLEILQANRGLTFTAQEIAKTLGINSNTAPLILANLVRSRKAEKTVDGKYIAVISHPMNAAV